MSRNANFEIVSQADDRLVLCDLGPWSSHLTITNDAEHVVEAMGPTLRGRRLFYYDSEGELTELLVKDGKFAGFGFVEGV